jgi:hypothetical protein
VWSCTSSLPYAFVMCTGTTKCYIYQIVETLSWYILSCYFYDFHFMHWKLEICLFPLHHRTLSCLKKMFVSLLCMTLFDTVLYTEHWNWHFVNKYYKCSVLLKYESASLCELSRRSQTTNVSRNVGNQLSCDTIQCYVWS